MDGIDAMVNYLCDEDIEKPQDVIFRCCDHILNVDPQKVLPVLFQQRDPPLDSQRVLAILSEYDDVRVQFLQHMVQSATYRRNRPEEYRELTTCVGWDRGMKGWTDVLPCHVCTSCEQTEY